MAIGRHFVFKMAFSNRHTITDVNKAGFWRWFSRANFFLQEMVLKAAYLVVSQIVKDWFIFFCVTLPLLCHLQYSALLQNTLADVLYVSLLLLLSSSESFDEPPSLCFFVCPLGEKTLWHGGGQQWLQAKRSLLHLHKKHSACFFLCF